MTTACGDNYSKKPQGSKEMKTTEFTTMEFNYATYGSPQSNPLPHMMKELQDYIHTYTVYRVYIYIYMYN